MDFVYSEKASELVAQIRKFVKVHLTKPEIAPGGEDESWDYSMEMSKKLADIGWLTMAWPKEYGGMGASVWERCVFGEEAAYWGIPGLNMGTSGTRWVGPALMLFGTEEQKKKYLPLIASGEDDGVWCTGYSEPDSGSDFASLQTRAERIGDEYIINGQKIWTSSGHHARYCWLAARTDPTFKKKHDGISIIIVDMKSEGVTVRPIPNIIGRHTFNETFFKDVRVPVKNLVGVENNGWRQLMQALAFERGVALGYSDRNRRMLDELVEFSKETGLIKRRDIRRKLAELAVDTRILRILALEAAWKAATGKRVIHEPSRDKAYNDGVTEKLTLLATEMIGAYSQVDPMNKKCKKYQKIMGIMESVYWHAPGAKIAAGTTDTQRNITAQFGLGLPRGY